MAKIDKLPKYLQEKAEEIKEGMYYDSKNNPECFVDLYIEEMSQKDFIKFIKEDETYGLIKEE